jgi:hypothetical protein
MMQARGRVIRAGSFLRSREQPELYLLSVHLDSRPPLAALAPDAFEGGPTIAPELVVSVLQGRGLAQIRDAVIRRVSVPVIDLSARVFAVNVEPSEPMGVMDAPLDSDGDVAARVRTAGLRSFGHAPFRYAPIKTAGVRVVVKQFPQPLRRELELAFAMHGCSPKAKRPTPCPSFPGKRGGKGGVGRNSPFQVSSSSGPMRDPRLCLGGAPFPPNGERVDRCVSWSYMIFLLPLFMADCSWRPARIGKGR